MMELLQKIKEFLELVLCYGLAGLLVLSFIVLICCVLYMKDKEAIEKENNMSKG